MNVNIKILLLTQHESKEQNKWSMLATTFNLGTRKRAFNGEASKSRRVTLKKQLRFKRVSVMSSSVPIWEWISPNISSKLTSLRACKCSYHTTAPACYITRWDPTPCPDGLQTALCCTSSNANSKTKAFLLRGWEGVLQVTLERPKTHIVLLSEE